MVLAILTCMDLVGGGKNQINIKTYRRAICPVLELPANGNFLSTLE